MEGETPPLGASVEQYQQFLQPTEDSTVVTPANSPADSEIRVSNSGKGELSFSSSLSWGFDEKENESKVAKTEITGKGVQEFHVSDDFSFFQDCPIPKKENTGEKK
ncbi:hypothetical protein T459_14877 [Capsicum annuum]|uniref:Uncharacterized protein n=1 Tax=Capsicum annuum TaxID=4072 RepID=A0A2G2ZIP4_CAPAN|nr:hypothetical protein T459_14877 [Capsicum annuum]